MVLYKEAKLKLLVKFGKELRRKPKSIAEALKLLVTFVKKRRQREAKKYILKKRRMRQYAFFHVYDIWKQQEDQEKRRNELEQKKNKTAESKNLRAVEKSEQSRDHQSNITLRIHMFFRHSDMPSYLC